MYVYSHQYVAMKLLKEVKNVMEAILAIKLAKVYTQLRKTMH